LDESVNFFRGIYGNDYCLFLEAFFAHLTQKNLSVPLWTLVYFAVPFSLHFFKVRRIGAKLLYNEKGIFQGLIWVETIFSLPWMWKVIWIEETYQNVLINIRKT